VIESVGNIIGFCTLGFKITFEGVQLKYRASVFKISLVVSVLQMVVSLADNRVTSLTTFTKTLAVLLQPLGFS